MNRVTIAAGIVNHTQVFRVVDDNMFANCGILSGKLAKSTSASGDCLQIE